MVELWLSRLFPTRGLPPPAASAKAAWQGTVAFLEQPSDLGHAANAMKYYTHHHWLRWHRDGSSPLVCRILLLLCFVLLFSTTAYSENTPANHAPGPVVQRGAKLWSLPIGGRLTLSRDGKTLLVASLADSNFYVVDVETGTIRRKLTPKFNWNSDAGTPFYQVDNDLKWIGLKASGYDGLWDIETDTLVTQLPKAMYDCLSKKLQRLVVRSALSNQPVLYDVTNNRAITEFSVSTSEYGIEEWFDDDRGLLYRSYDGS